MPTPIDAEAVKSLTGRERILYIAKRWHDGKVSREIAAELGISRQRVCRIAERAAIPIGKRGGTRYRGAHLPLRLSIRVSQIAAEFDVGESAMLALIVKAIVDNPSVAKPLLKRVVPRRRGE